MAIEMAHLANPCDKTQTCHRTGSDSVLASAQVKETVGKTRGEAWVMVLRFCPVRQHQIVRNDRKIAIVPQLFKKCPHPEGKLPE